MALNELSDQEMMKNINFDFIQELLSVLRPLEEAILFIGKNETDLVDSEAAFTFIFNSLHEWNSYIADELISFLKKKILIEQEF